MLVLYLGWRSKYLDVELERVWQVGRSIEWIRELSWRELL
jgi:hypothetical protein